MSRSLAAAPWLALLAIACTSDPGPGGSGLELAQSIPDATWAGDTLTVVVRVSGPLAEDGRLSWDVRAGGGRLLRSDETPGVDGLAVATWMLGQVAGQNRLSVALGGEPALHVDVAGTAFRVQQVAATFLNYCAIADGAVWCSNPGVVVGSRRAPTRVDAFDGIEAANIAIAGSGACITDVNGAAWCARFGAARAPVAVPPLRTIVGSGSRIFCGIAAADSTGWCWELAMAPVNVAQVSASLQFRKIPFGPPPGFPWCGLALDAVPWCWVRGQAPGPVTGIADVIDVGTLNREGCGITAARAVYCWGTDEMVAHREGQLMGDRIRCAETDCFVHSGPEVGYFSRFIGGSALPFLPMPFPVLESAPAGQWDHCIVASTSELYCSINLVDKNLISDRWGWPEDVYAVPVPP